MKTKKTFRKILYGLLALTSIIVCVVIILQATVKSDIVPLAPASEEIVTEDTISDLPIVAAVQEEIAKPTNPQAPQPSRIEIPSIGVKANIIPVGVTTKGAMATPGSYSEVGWYKYGAVPGEIGSAVLAGHVDNGLALPGVFKHLADVKNNDEIYITIGNTEKLRFKVISTAVYNYKDVPVQDIFGRDDDRYLTLVTCTGSLIRSEHTYDERLVVRAIRE